MLDSYNDYGTGYFYYRIAITAEYKKKTADSCTLRKIGGLFYTHFQNSIITT